MSDFPTHSAPQMKITNGKTVTTDKGYRMAKSSHGIWEGSWYFEVTIDDNPGHVRVGWSQISGDLQAPCGYDSFSYSFRDAPGTLFHQSKAVQDCPSSYLQGYGIQFSVILRSWRYTWSFYSASTINRIQSTRIVKKALGSRY